MTSSYISQFHHQLTGSETGRKWIFLHGLMGYAANWRTIIQKLGPKEKTLSYDQRGHGHTTLKPSTGYACEDYALDLKLILDELGWTQNVILVGHSMGGKNAMVFAAHYPEYLQGLVIEDMGPEADPRRILYFHKLFATIPTPFSSRQQAKEYFMNDFLKTSFARKMGPTLGSYLYSNLEEKPFLKESSYPTNTTTSITTTTTKRGNDSEKMLDWRFSKEGILETVERGRGKDHWKEFESISVPSLIIRGETSEELTKETLSDMLKRNPLAQGIEVPNAGHWVHYDQAALFVEHLLTFSQQMR